MANNPGAKKRIRQNAVRRLRNRYKLIGMRTAVKELREMTDKKEAEAKLPALISRIDKVAKANIIHKKNASHLKGKLTRFVNGLS